MPLSAGEVHADWAQYASADFTITSDLGLDEVTGIATALNALRQSVTDLPGLRADPDAEPRRYPPLQILIFSRRKDFTRITRKPVFAAFTQPGLTQTLLVVGPSGTRTSLTHNTLHEYTHYLLRLQAQNYPPWYEEGVATLLGHTRMKTTANGLRVETRLPRRLADDGMSVEALFGVRYYIDMPARRLQNFYASSAELVNFLLFANLASYPDYRPALERYLATRDVSAWTTDELSLGSLIKHARAYERRRSELSRSVDIETSRPVLERTPLTENEALRRIAQSAEAINPAESARIYGTLIAAAPDDLTLQNARIRSLIEVDIEAARRALDELKQLAPEDTGLLINDAAILTRDCLLRSGPDCRELWRSASALLRRALRQDPERIDAVLLLGVAELYSGRPGRAVNYLKATLNRVPWSPVVNFYYGECQRLLGTTQARPHLEKARSWALLDYIRELAEASLAELDGTAEPG